MSDTTTHLGNELDQIIRQSIQASSYGTVMVPDSRFELRCQLALIGWAVASAECSTSTSVRLRDACGSSSTGLLGGLGWNRPGPKMPNSREITRATYIAKKIPNWFN